jgi:glucose/arabinose dehydrogenase
MTPEPPQMKPVRVRRRRPPSHLRRLLLASLATVIIFSGVLAFLHRGAILWQLFGSHVVGGDPSGTTLHLPPGFSASIYVTGLEAPRFIAFGPDGALFVANRGANEILALLDPSHTGTATHSEVIVGNLNDPTSLAFRGSDLYVAEQTHITRFTLAPDLHVLSRQVIVPDLPSDGNHTTRTVLLGPEGNLYVSIGSTCNNCIESDPHRAAIWTYHLDGGGGRLYAHGLRNAVGMAINPWNHQIWVTNNGRDYLGDNLPPETVYALQDGGNYGWPRCQAGNIIDPDLGHPGVCNGVVQPLVKMQAHSAPLGLAFYRAAQFPQRYRGLYVAFHGSWNRSVPTGYKVVYIPLDAQGSVAGPPEDFATGWLKNSDDALGRPVGLAVGPDGALYVSDDKAGLIYRIAYTG